MAEKRQFCVYIMSNTHHTVFYTGVTNDLIRRVTEHKAGTVEGFTKKYNITKLLYYEIADDPSTAIMREKQVKKYRREKKFALIESMNPEWKDLFEEFFSHAGNLFVSINPLRGAARIPGGCLAPLALDMTILFVVISRSTMVFFRCAEKSPRAAALTPGRSLTMPGNRHGSR